MSDYRYLSASEGLASSCRESPLRAEIILDSGASLSDFRERLDFWAERDAEGWLCPLHTENGYWEPWLLETLDSLIEESPWFVEDGFSLSS